MPISAPPGAECYFTDEGLANMSSIFDDINWWRNSIQLPDDFKLSELADLIPDDDLGPHDRDVLRRDLEALSQPVQDATLSALRLAIRSADAIEIRCEDQAAEPGGQVIVEVVNLTVKIDLRLYCVDHQP
jgi:hypothetical protein